MGNGEVDQSSKEGKEAQETKTHLQEPSSAGSVMVSADWPGFQAYSPLPPHGFLASSPQPHPYMWGVQQFIPPYGTPPHPYVTMYPYGHPTMVPGSYPFSPFAMPSPNGVVEGTGNSTGNMEVDGKTFDKEKLPIKRSRESLGSLITGKNIEHGKPIGVSVNGVHSESPGNGSEGSSEGSDDNSQNDSIEKTDVQQDSAELSQNGNVAHSSQNGELATPHPMSIVPVSAAGAVSDIPGPITNLNIGIDYWSAAASSSPIPARGSTLTTPVAGGVVNSGSRDNCQSQLWMQDARELKRQRRKQSNRESARRSRLRKQAECDELASQAEALNEENASLRAELARIRSEYEQIFVQNASLKERLGELPDQDNPRCRQDDTHSGHDSANLL